MIELACPESCPYLIEARATASEREMVLLRKEIGKDERDLTFNDRTLLAIDRIQLAIVNAQRGVGAAALRDLDDASMLAAIENAIKNFETEESGLIYEHRAASPQVNEISHRIREGLDEITNVAPPEACPRRSEIFRALTFMREAVNAHITRAAGDPEASRTFTRYLTLFYPWPEEATRPLII